MRALPTVFSNFAVKDDDTILSFLGKISDQVDWKRVHERREECDGVLVGKKTFLKDKPNLLPRIEYLGRYPKSLPKRYILSSDPSFDAPKGYHPLICTNLDLQATLAKLANNGVKKLLVEGGLKVHQSLLKQQLVNTFTCFMLSKNISKTIRNLRKLIPYLNLADDMQIEEFATGFLLTAEFSNPAAYFRRNL